MRYFITGGTGFIGRATIQDLRDANHEVLALARSAEAAASLEAMGAVPHPGELTDAASLAAGAKQCDGVIHLAFDHRDLRAWADNDREAVATFAGALAGSGKALVISSVVAIVTPGILATEADMPSSHSVGGFRAASEHVAREAASNGVRSSIVRLPPTVHGPEDGMFIAHLIGIARRTGVSGYVEDGRNRWPAVHRRDAARLYRLAAEKGEAGECFHAVAEGNIPFRAIAEVIGDKLGIRVCAIAAEDAADHFGFLAHFVGMDCPAASAITRNRLGWTPLHPDLLADLRGGSYFDAAAQVVDISH